MAIRFLHEDNLLALAAVASVAAAGVEAAVRSDPRDIAVIDDDRVPHDDDALRGSAWNSAQGRARADVD